VIEGLRIDPSEMGKQGKSYDQLFQEAKDRVLPELQQLAENEYRTEFPPLENPNDFDGSRQELQRRMDEQMIHLAFLPNDVVKNQPSERVEEYEVDAAPSAIVGKADWDDWRGRGEGKGAKKNEVTNLPTVSADHIVDIAIAKIDGSFDPNKEVAIIARELVDDTGATYYYIDTGGHRAAAAKLTGDQESLRMRVLFRSHVAGDIQTIMAERSKERATYRLLYGE
jgi:hypothetical protein